MYYKNYPHLFSPGKIGKIEIKNRIVMAPFGTAHTGVDHSYNSNLISFYERRAKGGVGMIVAQAGYVQTDIDPFPLITIVPRIDSHDKIAGLAKYAETARSYGAVACCQISLGCGRQADAPSLFPPVSSSPCTATLDSSIQCRELSVDEIHSLVASAAKAAKYALTAGVQILEIHGHSGYLIDQFLSRDVNKRTDEYGGSAENRFRIVREVREAIREAVGDQIAVTLRISVDHKFSGGRTLDEGIEYCRLAEAAGYDALHIDAGRYEVMPWIFPTSYLGPMCMRDLAAAVKKAVSIPVIAVGNFGTPEEAEEALSAGDCDFVALARGLIAEPDWAEKALTGHVETIRPCLRCNEYCLGRTGMGIELNCAVNPEAGREYCTKISKAEHAKHVVVVGGGPGGMQAALTAAMRGHRVTLFEKSDRLGGLMNLSEQEIFKYPMAQLKKWYIHQLELHGIEVILNTPADVSTVKKAGAESVIVATGSDVFIPNIPGFRGRKDVVTIRGLKDIALTGDERIVTAGGGIVACEAALGLAMAGHDVSIVEMLSDVANGLHRVNKAALKEQLIKYNVHIYTSSKCERIEGNTLYCTDANGVEHPLSFDYTLVALGTHPESSLNEAFTEAFPDVQLVGDCVTAGRIHIAIHQGYLAGSRV